MIKYIVFLRGINVGGHKKTPMSELRDVLSSAGFNSIKTYIQSGNIVLKSALSEKEQIETKIQKVIHEHFGFEVPAIAKTKEQLKTIFDNCPYSQAKKEQSYFVILSHVPNPDLVRRALEKQYDNEEFKIVKECLYFYSSAGYGKSKFNMNWFEKTLEVKATSRNYKTMLKLLAMSSENK